MNTNKLDEIAKKLDKASDNINKTGNSFMKAGCSLFFLIFLVIVLYMLFS